MPALNSVGVEEQNRDMLQFLLAPDGAVTLIKEHFQDLQLFLSKRMIPVCIGNELTAMIELSRPGHAFRRSDLQRAERIVQRALRQRTN